MSQDSSRFLHDEENWGCRRKKQYPTQRSARKHASKVLHIKGDRLRPYRCFFCRQWHLAS